MTARVLVPGLALFLVALSGHTAPGQDRPIKPSTGTGRPAAPDAAPMMQIQIYTLQSSDAAEMLQTLKDLFIGDDAKKIRLTLHRSTNSLVAMATESDLERVGAIIAKLETTAAGKQKAAGKDQRGEKPIDAAQQKVAHLQSEVEQARERAAWAERMVKMGYMSAAQAKAEQTRSNEATLKLITAQQELDFFKAAQGNPAAEKALTARLAPSQTTQEKPKAAAGVAWEYKVIETTDDKLETELNKTATDGWELFKVLDRQQGNILTRTLVFKRPKR